MGASRRHDDLVLGHQGATGKRGQSGKAWMARDASSSGSGAQVQPTPRQYCASESLRRCGRCLCGRWRAIAGGGSDFPHERACRSVMRERPPSRNIDTRRIDCSPGVITLGAWQCRSLGVDGAHSMTDQGPCAEQPHPDGLAIGPPSNWCRHVAAKMRVNEQHSRHDTAIVRHAACRRMSHASGRRAGAAWPATPTLRNRG